MDMEEDKPDLSSSLLDIFVNESEKHNPTCAESSNVFPRMARICDRNSLSQ